MSKAQHITAAAMVLISLAIGNGAQTMTATAASVQAPTTITLEA